MIIGKSYKFVSEDIGRYFLIYAKKSSKNQLKKTVWMIGKLINIDTTKGILISSMYTTKDFSQIDFRIKVKDIIECKQLKED